ncbi:IclR family transcriptional regulator [Halopiger goleimassiliensis]|uniref:IclR family transcriptional regulator n=1 Tax=Halopiger goleimassiliensis TaxID=1293048 RepID=UPI000677AB28|nr:IclR family transcriptional regulator [Halopiger goleimassiliensis]
MSRTGRRLKTLETAIELLDILSDADGCSLTEVSDELGLAKSTVHGYVKTLEQDGYVHEVDGQYYVGAELLTLGGQVRHRHPSYQHVIEKIQQVSEETSERAQFVIEEGRKAIHVHTEKGTKGVEVDARIGKQSYLHASAAGKAILAWSPEQVVTETIERHGLPSLTPNTITSEDELRDELSRTRERGFAQNEEESIEGLHAVGVPITKEQSVIGAISVSGPSHRLSGAAFDEEIPQFLLGISNELELRLSYDNVQ